jgi:hypothetical protein
MDRLFPKKNPEAAKKFAWDAGQEAHDIEQQMKLILALFMAPMPCPMCFEKVSVYDAADETRGVSDNYNGKDVCPNCNTGHAGVALAAEAPDPGQEAGQARLLLTRDQSPRRRARRDHAPRREGAEQDRSTGSHRCTRRASARHRHPARRLLAGARLDH